MLGGGFEGFGALFSGVGDTPDGELAADGRVSERGGYGEAGLFQITAECGDDDGWLAQGVGDGIGGRFAIGEQQEDGV